MHAADSEIAKRRKENKKYLSNQVVKLNDKKEVEKLCNYIGEEGGGRIILRDTNLNAKGLLMIIAKLNNKTGFGWKISVDKKNVEIDYGYFLPKELILSNTSKSFFKEVIKILLGLGPVQKLQLTNNDYGDMGVLAVCSYIEKHRKTLDLVNLVDSKMTMNGFNRLVESLHVIA